MHTIFINTTKNTIGGRFDALKNAKELRKLMYVNYPLERWNDENNGYESIVRQISEYIDNYSYISNIYNLVIYVNMMDVFELLKISFCDASEMEKTLLADACKTAVVRLISETLINKLKDEERHPAEMPVLLFEMPKTKELSSGIEKTKHQIGALMKILNFVPMDQLKQKLQNSDCKTEMQLLDIIDDSNKNTQFNLYSVYRKSIQIFLDSVCKDDVSVERACEDFYRITMSLYSSDCIHNIKTSEFYTKNATHIPNKEVNIKHNFLLQCFILRCVNDESVFDKNDEVRRIAELSESDWEKIKQLLYKKQKKYEIQRRKIVNYDIDYTDIGLAPPLYALARESFGLNENGTVSVEYDVEEVKKDKKKAKSKNKDNKSKGLYDKNNEEPLVTNDSVLVEKRGIAKNWLHESVYKPYDSNGDKYIADKGSVTADEYCERAKDLANHHLNIFNKLNIHIKRTMSNYSGRSVSNVPPILRKRSVNMGEDATESDKNDYKYAKRENTKIVEETEPTETIIETSKRSYISIMIEYLKFDAGRGIVLNNVKEQTEWFINRIRQIDESLKKLLWILVIMIFTLAVVYMPFVLIQWNSIVKNVDTIVVALLSIITPYVLLFLIYNVCKVIQKRKMKIAWETLVDVSLKASEENKKIIASYDAMMTRYIPALRWLYEYVLDVGFHCDCCDIARAKLMHHREKLLEVAEDLNNFLEDLDYSATTDEKIEDEDFVDYTNAFCEGEKNIDFYSIVDKELLNIVDKEKGGLV